MASSSLFDLTADTRAMVQKLLDYADSQGISTRVLDTFRSYDEQEALYAKGRTEPGPRVTGSRGGWSWHNHGRAVDIYVPDWNLDDYNL